MAREQSVKRRALLKTGLAAAAACALPGVLKAAKPAPQNETRVLFLGGDYYHSGIVMELHWREVLAGTGWRLRFAQSSRFITPAVLRNTDLFVLIRGEGPDSLGWSPEGIVEERPLPAPFMTGEQEQAIVENVHRGMGLLCMHSSTRHPERKKFLDLIAVEQPLRHGPLQRIRFHSMNRQHPITKDIDEFEIDLDQTGHVDVRENEVTILFRSTGMRDNREDVMGWCLERGEGRIAALLPGHLPAPRQSAQYKLMMWRAAHWALRRDIPHAEFKNGISYL